MLLRFFLWLNSKFPEVPHPFHQADENSPLPYAHFEYEQAEKMQALYDQALQKRGLYFSQWMRGKVIADFCCGGGGKSVSFAKLGAAKVVGLDINQIFIEQAKKIARAKNVEDRTEFLLENVCATTLPSNQFDGVIFSDAIDHIDKPKKAIEEALRILKPGGFIFVNFESYYFPWGHHLLDAVRIPWIHLFTTESFRIKLYKALIANLPDEKERLQFRLGYDERGRERITYLNHLTIRKFQKILENFMVGRQHRNIRHPARKIPAIKILASHKVPLRRKPFQILGKIPFLKEFFSSTHVWVLEKRS